MSVLNKTLSKAPLHTGSHLHTSSVRSPHVRADKITKISRGSSSLLPLIQQNGVDVERSATLNFTGNTAVTSVDATTASIAFDAQPTIDFGGTDVNAITVAGRRVALSDDGDGVVTLTIAAADPNLGDVLLTDDDGGGTAITAVNTLVFSSTGGIMNMDNTASSSLTGSGPALAIGSSAEAGTNAIAIGRTRNTQKPQAANDSVAIGLGARSTGGNSIAVGGDRAYATGLSAIALGAIPRASGDYSIAIGNDAAPSAVASGRRSIAIGRLAQATNTDSIALMHNAYSSGLRAIAIGYSASALHTDSVALGTDATTRAPSSVALRGVHYVRAPTTTTTSTGDFPFTLAEFALNDGDVVVVNATVTMRQTAGASTGSRLYQLRYLHASRTGSTVTVVTRPMLTVVTSGYDAAPADQITLSATDAGTGVQLSVVEAEAGTRIWNATLEVLCVPT